MRMRMRMGGAAGGDYSDLVIDGSHAVGGGGGGRARTGWSAR